LNSVNIAEIQLLSYAMFFVLDKTVTTLYLGLETSWSLEIIISLKVMIVTLPPMAIDLLVKFSARQTMPYKASFYQSTNQRSNVCSS